MEMYKNDSNIENEGLVLLNDESTFLNLFYTEDEHCCASCSHCPAHYVCTPCKVIDPDD